MFIKKLDRPIDGRSISIRSIKPKFEDATSRHWFGGNPFLSHMVHALSFLFPPGEETFVKSVNYYKDQITDPQLRKAVKAFAGQEFMHSKVHHDFNDWISSKIPAADEYCKRVAEDISNNYQRLEKKKPIANLAITVGLEHLTAIMAATFLRRPDILERISPDIRSLLIWHAIEEIEHKDVAFDVYKTVGGGYWLRVTTFLMSTFMIILNTTTIQARLLIKDGEWYNYRAALFALKQLFGSNGFFTEVSRSYFQYFKPSFHPSQQNDQELVEQWQLTLQTLTPVKISGKVELDAVHAS